MRVEACADADLGSAFVRKPFVIRGAPSAAGSGALLTNKGLCEGRQPHPAVKTSSITSVTAPPGAPGPRPVRGSPLLTSHPLPASSIQKRCRMWPHTSHGVLSSLTAIRRTGSGWGQKHGRSHTLADRRVRPRVEACPSVSDITAAALLVT